jgi:hypothetical protein
MSEKLDKKEADKLINEVEKSKDNFLSKEEIRKAIVMLKKEVDEEDSDFAKGWRNGLTRLFWELKL